MGRSSRSHFAQPTNAHLRSSSATPSGGSSRSNTGGPTGVSSVRAPEEVVANPVYQKPVILISTPVSHAGNGSRSLGLAATGFIPVGIQVDATVVGESQLFQEKTGGFGESHARGESSSNLKRALVSESVAYGLHVTAELPNPSPQRGTPSGVVKGKSTSPNLGTWKKRAHAHGGLGASLPSRGPSTGKRQMQHGAMEFQNVDTGSRIFKKQNKGVVVNSKSVEVAE
ncbi:hypothetical protein FCV25MIE_01450 [Fagus crenata]